MCDKTLWDDPTGLRCVRRDEHTTHLYEGSFAPDRHDQSEAMES